MGRTKGITINAPITYPQYSMYLYITTAIPIAIAANKTDVMSIIQRHSVNPMNERILKERREKNCKGIDELDGVKNNIRTFLSQNE
jgi:hypothetical protein